MTEPHQGKGKPTWAFALRGEGTDTLEIDIFDIVGGGFLSEGVSAKSVRDRLSANKDAKSLKVRINSKGGEVQDGIAIYEQLRDHAAPVDVQIVGTAASIASLIAMAGDTISISGAGFVMIHDPYIGLMFGANAEDLRAKADMLEQFRETIADVYTTRTGQKKTDVRKWMAAETWMRPAQAKERGFVTEVLPMKQAPGKASNQALDTVAIFNMSDRELFANVPDELVAQAVPIEPAATAAPAEPITSATAHLETTNMSDPILTTVRALLNLGAGTPDTDVTAAVSRLRDLEREVVTLTGAKSTEEAVGGIRAMHAKAAKTDTLEAELATVKGERDKQNFDALIMKAQSERKLTPALVTKVWQPEFDAAQVAGNGADVVKRLTGYIAHASPIIGAAPRQPAANVSTGGEAAAMLWNGKTYDALTYSQRAKLKTEDPELWDLMKKDFEARSAA